ncbi:hypothetical protein FHL15_007496 [Xylaria flabelliformis]|uniref:Glucose-methanol-choline oxidoreductase N-terminal domain-containing protein n=1 Tax=Xylaria flabelliformis TaxID=2512241 RepID=A0A553HUU4_9PEZI|nr:hypothetical protein FHL15_007496 [Xylaria flabelliformis]
MKSVLSLALLTGVVAGLPSAGGGYTEEYEYVIIGSVSANLARDGHSVFLIEAGEDKGDTLLQRAPAYADTNSEHPDQSWAFFVGHYQNDTQARRDWKFTYRLNNGSLYYGLDPPDDAEPLGIFYPRGASVGGSSQANAMNFILPPDNNWEYIAELTGDDSWRAQNMRDYFIQLERNLYTNGEEPGHGYNGYISSNMNNISYVLNRPGFVDMVSSSIQETEGIKVESREQMTELLQRDLSRIDTNRYEQGVVFRFPLHINALRERSSARDYVIDTLNSRTSDGTERYPLTLSTNSLATRVLFDTTGDRPKAYGVEYLKGEGLYGADRRYNASQTGELKQVTATREVIVAGGAFNTPQILKLSGVGPREELENLDIPVVKDLPAVGNYMQDNYEGPIVVRAATTFSDGSPYVNCTFDYTNPETDPCFNEWHDSHTGAYGEGGAPIAMLYRSSHSENNDTDLFFFGAPGAVFDGHYPGCSQYQAPPETWFWSMVKMQPGNQAGTIRLRSANPRDVPEIQFNFFEQDGDRDLAAMVEGVEHAMRIFDGVQAPYAPFEIVEPSVPGSGVSVEQGIRDLAFGHHVTSTCRMGPKDAEDYCVDSEFRVNGIDGLRVVDASVFPRTPGAFPVAPTFMISYKAYKLLVAEAAAAK